MKQPFLSIRARWLALAASGLLVACGGGSADKEAGPEQQALASGAGTSAGSAQNAAPPIRPKRMTQRDAVRLADQTTFGATETLIASLRGMGAGAWVEQQMALNSSRYTRGGSDSVHRDVGPVGVCERAGASPNCWRDEFSAEPLVWDFYRNATTGNDQLRQRVAFALQQILVVSELEVQGTYGLRNYQNLFLEQAFGNYRELLRRVTLSPVMGDYLDHVNNDPVAPNENFARELLQLFSIGTCELELDGRLRGGSCQPTYDNTLVRNYAHALTGWTYPAGGSTAWGCWPEGTNCQFYGGDMVARPARHDGTARTLLSGRSKPAGSTPAQALDAVLDSLMAHPNIGPFVSLRLIQSLSSSNPSPAYVNRVARAFNSGRLVLAGRTFGTGQRGDLAATVAAVILDSEARGDNPTANAGRLREPVLFMTGAIRLLGGRSDGAALGWWWGEAFKQHVFRSPSVFNFFPPDYPVPGTALVGPAFGIHNANSALERLNFLTYLLDWNGSDPDDSIPGAFGTRVDLGSWQARSDDAAALLDQMALAALGRPLPEPARSRALLAVQWWTPATDADNWRNNRVKTAAQLVLAAPGYQLPR